MRTENEHPLKLRDLDLLSKYFNNVEIKYYLFLTLLAVPFRTFFFFNKLCDLLLKVDKFVLNIPYMNRLAWVIIVDASNPRK